MERNEALLRKVGDVIANEPERYDQSQYLAERSCGTVACIAGHAALLTRDMESHPFVGAPLARVARKELGLSHQEAVHLFSSNWRPAGDLGIPLHERVRDALYALAEGASVEEVSA